MVVTGAQGFIGRHVCDTLARAGWDVVGLSRERVQLSALGTGGARDWQRAEAVASAMSGAGAVVHLAGLAHVLDGSAADDEYYAANAVLTSSVVQAAAAADVATFLFMSSAAAGLGPELLGRADPYAASKRAAENIVARVSEEHRMTPWILRPPLVYGPGMKGNPLRLFRLVHARVPLPLAAVRNLRSFVYVGNLAAAVCSALATEGDPGGTFYVTDWPAMSTPDFVRAIGEAMRLPARLLPLPVGLLRAAARSGDALRALGVSVPGTADLERLVSSSAVDGGELRCRTGYTPPVSLAVALQITSAWFIHRQSDHKML